MPEQITVTLTREEIGALIWEVEEKATRDSGAATTAVAKLQATLDNPQPEHVEVTLGSGEKVRVPPEVAPVVNERDTFAVLAGWNYEGDGEHGEPWDFERVKQSCLDVQHEDAAADLEVAKAEHDRLTAPQPERYTRGEVEERLELVVLCGELRRIAEEGKVPNPSEHGLAVDVLTWAEGWLLQLSAAFPDQQPEPLGGISETRSASRQAGLRK